MSSPTARLASLVSHIGKEQSDRLGFAFASERTRKVYNIREDQGISQTMTSSKKQKEPANRRYKVVVARDLGPDVMPLLHERRELDLVIWPENRQCEREWLLKNAPGSAGIIVMLSEQINEELLDAAGPSLKVISTMSVGYEHCDLKALQRRGVRLGYTPDVLTDAVADVAVMLALMASRNAKETMSIVYNNQWPDYTWSPFSFCGPQISCISVPRGAAPTPERTVGFLGFGRIAHATLARLVPFGVRRCIFSTNPARSLSAESGAEETTFLESLSRKLGLPQGALQRVDIDRLARESDVLFVLAPGGAATRHVINEDFLRKMKKTSILVNPSRGTLVDSDALAKALREDWIWGAGVDVVEGEPNVSADHPLVKEPRCIVLPHIGSATFETRLGMATLAAKNLIAGVFDEEFPAELDLKGQV